MRRALVLFALAAPILFVAAAAAQQEQKAPAVAAPSKPDAKEGVARLPTANPLLSEGECTGLGGTVVEGTACASNKTCFTTDANNVVHHTCITTDAH